jgi:RHS repeat-associated protein
MVDEDNIVVWEAKYRPFGEAQVHPYSTVTNNFRFPGQYYDAETGLHYNYHRYYDPRTGRYLRPDPIGLEGGINLFVYAMNDPINEIDPSGLKTTFKMRSLGGAQLIVGGLIGSATATSDCEDGKYYEAKYLVIGTGLGASLNLKLDVIVSAIIKNLTSSTFAKTFTLESNYPGRYISYLDIEGHAASLIYGATFVDAKVGAYEGGRKDVSVISHGLKGDIGAQIFNFQGIHFIRMSIEEKCCGK